MYKILTIFFFTFIIISQSSLALFGEDSYYYYYSPTIYNNGTSSGDRWLISSKYLYNDSTTLYFNETELNSTIDARGETSYSNSTPITLEGTVFGLIVCGNGEILKYNGVSELWECDDDDNSGNTYTAGNYLYLDGLEFNVNETELNNTIDLRDSDTTYTAGNNLTLDGTEFNWDSSWAEGYFILVTEEGNLNVNDTDYLDGLDSTAFILTTSESDLNVNSSNYWDSYDVVSDLNNLITLYAENITAGTIDWARLPVFYEANISDLQSYILTSSEGDLNVNNSDYLEGHNAAYFIAASTEGNLNVNDTEYLDGLDSTEFILASTEGDLNTNSSNYWDNLDTINATQMEENEGTLNIVMAWLRGLFVDETGDTMSGNLEIDGNLVVNGSAVFNDNSEDFDFRVESDDNENMFFVDASADRVCIGCSSADSTLHIAGEARIVTAGTTALLMEGPAGSNNNQMIFRNEGGGANGKVMFYQGIRSDDTDFWFYGYNGSVWKNMMKFDWLDDTVYFDWGAVFNDAGTDSDFRVESDDNENMLFVDASKNKIGIGTGSPSYPLDVNGSGIRLKNPSGNAYAYFDSGDEEDYKYAGFRFEHDDILRWNFYKNNNENGDLVFSGYNTTGHYMGQWINMLWDTDDEIGRIKINPSDSIDDFRVDIRGDTVFNEGSKDFDFRVESDNQTHMFFVDASKNNIGIGTDSPGFVTEIVGTDASDHTKVVVKGRDDADAGKHTYLIINSAATTGRRAILQLEAQETGDANSDQFVFNLKSDSDEMTMSVRDGDAVEWLQMATVSLAPQYEYAINDDGDDMDYRVESNNMDNIFKIDASRDEVQIGEAHTGISSGVIFTMANNGNMPMEMISVSDTAFYRGIVNFFRARGEIGDLDAVVNNDYLGDFQFKGYNGTDYVNAAEIVVLADGAPGKYTPGELIFKTSTDTSGLTNRLVISPSGEVTIGAISGDGNGKVVCIKADGSLGTCTDQPGAGGTCTCT